MILADDEGNSEFKFRALPGHHTLRVWCSDSGCGEEESLRLTRKGFLLQYKVATGELVSTQFVDVLLQRTFTRRTTLSSLFYVFNLYFYYGECEKVYQLSLDTGRLPRQNDPLRKYLSKMQACNFNGLSIIPPPPPPRPDVCYYIV